MRILILIVFSIILVLCYFNVCNSQIIELNFTRRKKNKNNKTTPLKASTNYTDKNPIFYPSNILENHLDNENNYTFLQNFFLLNSLEKSNLIFLDYLNNIDIPVEFNDNYQLIASLGIGSYPQFSEVLLDTGSNILWIAGIDCIPCKGIKYRFNHSKSLTYKNTTQIYDIVYGTGSTRGYLSYDNVLIGNLTVDEFKFLLSYDSGTDMFSDGILGLGNFYVNMEDSFSLIDQLFYQGKISRRIFSQKLNKDETGILNIGDFPEEIKNNKNDTGLSLGKCACLPISMYRKPNIYWECELDQIFFGNDINNTINVNSRINFDTGTNFILMPQFFLKKYIIDVYLRYYFERLLCVAKPVQDFIHIICDSSLVYSDLENLNFRFGEYVIIFRPEELFEDYGRILQFKISSSMEESLDLWILGAPLLKKFLMVFDKDNQEISFYGRDVKNVGEIKEKTNTLLIIILILSGCLVILLVFNLIKYFIKKNKYRDEQYNYVNFNINNNPYVDNRGSDY